METPLHGQSKRQIALQAAFMGWLELRRGKRLPQQRRRFLRLVRQKMADGEIVEGDRFACGDRIGLQKRAPAIGQPSLAAIEHALRREGAPIPRIGRDGLLEQRGRQRVMAEKQSHPAVGGGDPGVVREAPMSARKERKRLDQFAPCAKRLRLAQRLFRAELVFGGPLAARMGQGRMPDGTFVAASGQSDGGAAKDEQASYTGVHGFSLDPVPKAKLEEIRDKF